MYPAQVHNSTKIKQTENRRVVKIVSQFSVTESIRGVVCL